MADNPFKSPENDNDIGARAPSPRLDENIKELLGIAKDDFWYYPGFALLVAACFFSSVPFVFFLFALSTVFVVTFLVKSFPKYIWSSELAPVTKVYGFLGNLALISLQLVVVSVKSWFLFF